MTPAEFQLTALGSALEYARAYFIWQLCVKTPGAYSYTSRCAEVTSEMVEQEILRREQALANGACPHVRHLRPAMRHLSVEPVPWSVSLP